MKRRERILLLILVAGMLVWLGRGPASRLFYEPIEQLDSQIKIINREIAERELEEIQLMSAAKSTKAWKRLSLPPDPLKAQRLYQSWLTDLAQTSGLQGLKVTPESRNPTGNAFVGVQVRLKAEGTLAQTVLFLREFYRAELLHRINSIELESDVTGRSPIVSVTLVAEGLSLTTAPQRRGLFPQSSLVNSISTSVESVSLENASEFPEQAGFLVRIDRETLKVKEINENSWLVERGFDSSEAATHESGAIVQMIPLKGFNGVSAAFTSANPFLRPPAEVAANHVTAKESEVEIDEAEYTFLISAIADDDEREAWLFNRLNNSKQVIKEGKAFSIAGIEGLLLEIQRDFVLVRRDNVTWRLDVGDNMRSMRRVDD